IVERADVHELVRLADHRLPEADHLDAVLGEQLHRDVREALLDVGHLAGRRIVGAVLVNHRTASWCRVVEDDIPSRARRRGMAGKYFEELKVGDVFRHEVGRTITEADNVFFSTLTMNPQPLHIDFHAAAKAEFGKPLVNSLLTLGIAIGISVGETTLGTTVGNLGFDKVEFPKPVFHGDTIYAETEIVDKRESKSRPQWGIVTFEHRAKNQHGDLVMRARRNAMMRKRA